MCKENGSCSINFCTPPTVRTSQHSWRWLSEQLVCSSCINDHTKLSILFGHKKDANLDPGRTSEPYQATPNHICHESVVVLFAWLEQGVHIHVTLKALLQHGTHLLITKQHSLLKGVETLCFMGRQQMIKLDGIVLILWQRHHLSLIHTHGSNHLRASITWRQFVCQQLQKRCLVWLMWHWGRPLLMRQVYTSHGWLLSKILWQSWPTSLILKSSKSVQTSYGFSLSSTKNPTLHHTLSGPSGWKPADTATISTVTRQRKGK